MPVKVSGQALSELFGHADELQQICGEYERNGHPVADGLKRTCKTLRDLAP